MEKGPKIGKSLGGNVAIPEFQKRETGFELQPEPKEPQTELSEKPGDFERDLNKKWFELVYDAKHEFPEEVQVLLDKQIQHKPLSPEERSIFDLAVNKWWKESFGITFDKRKEPPKDTFEIKRQKEKIGLQAQKINRMEQLHNAIKNLDEGEPVDEFRDETRKVLYHDGSLERYFTEDNNKKVYLGLGDVISDYAWGIKYVPDGEMEEPTYRILAKRILINEARRDLEILNDVGLTSKATVENHLPTDIEKKVVVAKNKKARNEKVLSHTGFLAEAVARELLTRAAINNDLDFAVLRANLIEDFDYKYDFKLRLKKKLRGIKIEDGKEIGSNIRKIGIQFTTSIHTGNRKRLQIEQGKQAVKKLAEGGLRKLPVDEILLLQIPIYKEVAKIYQEWLEAGKPSGGPEQFLSRDLKIELLKAVTGGLIEISDEEIEKIFPKEEASTAN